MFEPDTKSNSYVERQNLNMRMGMRRYTRRSNGFSKKLDNLWHMLNLYYVYYNFVRVHMTLGTTPAIAAGLEERVWDMRDVVRLVNEAWAMPVRPKTYRKRKAA